MQKISGRQTKVVPTSIHTAEPAFPPPAWRSGAAGVPFAPPAVRVEPDESTPRRASPICLVFSYDASWSGYGEH